MPSVSASENGVADIVESVETDEGVVVEPDKEALLGHANRLFELGCSALRSQQYDEACDCIGKALEIRVQHYGELAIECAPTLYKYGCALLYKVQSESDALGQTDGARDKAETLSTEAIVKSPDGDDENTDDESDAEDDDECENANCGVGDANGDGMDDGMSDLQLAWENLDLARHIYQSQAQRSLEEVDVIAALADVSLEKEDFKSCCDDYTSALGILEKLVEPDDRRLAELCFKLCLALQLNNNAKDAMEYCNRAVSVCEARLEKLKNQISEKPSEEPVGAEENKIAAEITEIEELLVDLREKVLELQEMTNAPSLMEALQAANPSAAASVKLVLSAVATSMSERIGEPSKGTGNSPASSSNGFDESAMSGSSTCVTDLGVVGRGVKRAAPIPLPAGQTSSKRRTLEELMNGGSSTGHAESGSSSRMAIAGDALENGGASPQVSAGVSSNTTTG